MSKCFTAFLLILAASLNATLVSPALADEALEVQGNVLFTNITASLTQLEPAPYIGTSSGSLGFSLQSGSILPDSPPSPAGNVLTFTGKQGPNPYFFNLPIHVIANSKGLLFCTWTADFTIRPVSETTGVFSGDGDFRIIGGIGRYWRASGSFNTYFETGEIPLNADAATAEFQQSGTISR